MVESSNFKKSTKFLLTCERERERERGIAINKNRVKQTLWKTFMDLIKKT